MSRVKTDRVLAIAIALFWSFSASGGDDGGGEGINDLGQLVRIGKADVGPIIVYNKGVNPSTHPPSAEYLYDTECNLIISHGRPSELDCRHGKISPLAGALYKNRGESRADFKASRHCGLPSRYVCIIGCAPLRVPKKIVMESGAECEEE